MTGIILRRLLFVSVAGAIIALVVLFTCGSPMKPVSNTPDGIALAAIESLERQDIDATCSYFTGSAYHQMREGLLGFYAYSTVGVDNVVVSVVKPGETIATVYIEYDLRLESFSYENTIHIKKEVQVIKSQGTWYLNSTI